MGVLALCKNLRQKNESITLPKENVVLVFGAHLFMLLILKVIWWKIHQY
ncbi:conserved hypothetical protein [Vibrio chagasii]|nr:conserved hypothetical protein [Vibrio chagasii]